MIRVTQKEHLTDCCGVLLVFFVVRCGDLSLYCHVGIAAQKERVAIGACLEYEVELVDHLIANVLVNPSIRCKKMWAKWTMKENFIIFVLKVWGLLG